MRIIMQVFVMAMISVAWSVKILQFDDTREEKTSSRLRNGASGTTTDLSLCIDFKINQVKDSQILLTNNGKSDLIILCPDNLDRFYIAVKGIWYLTPTYNIIHYEWGTLCFSYASSTNTVSFAYKGEMMFTKADPLQQDSSFTQNFLQSLVLGLKTASDTLVADITRLNIWSKAMDAGRLTSESACEGEASKFGTPDLLAWELSRWEGEGKEIQSKTSVAPCESVDPDITNVMMPYKTEGIGEAHTICGQLGGVMAVPKSEDDMKRLMQLAMTDVEISDCSEYIWVAAQVNQEDQWTVSDGSEESLEPDSYVSPKWLGWARGQPNGLGLEAELELCAAAYIAPGTPQLYDVGCVNEGYCYICSFEVPFLFLTLFTFQISGHYKV